MAMPNRTQKFRSNFIKLIWLLVHSELIEYQLGDQLASHIDPPPAGRLEAGLTTTQYSILQDKWILPP